MPAQPTPDAPAHSTQLPTIGGADSPKRVGTSDQLTSAL